jgi:hypothetical protein
MGKLTRRFAAEAGGIVVWVHRTDAPRACPAARRSGAFPISFV